MSCIKVQLKRAVIEHGVRNLSVVHSTSFFLITKRFYKQNIKNNDTFDMATRLVLMFQLYLYIFFLIGNRSFIEKMNKVFMMMNTLDMKKLQKAQELQLRDNRL